MRTTSVDTLAVVWRHPRRAPFAVGELSYDGTTHRFRYLDTLRVARAAGFNPSEFGLTGAFPDLDIDHIYESAKLFPVFASRLPDKRRPDYALILARFGASPETHPFEILKKTRGRLGTDDLGVEQELTLRGQLTLEAGHVSASPAEGKAASAEPPVSFTCHVVGWHAHGGDRILDQLAPGTVLRLEHEQENRHDRNAIAVREPQAAKLGYLPVRFGAHVARALGTGWRVEARLLEVKPPPHPPAERALILVEISGRPSSAKIRQLIRSKFQRRSLPRKLPDPPAGDLEGHETILIGHAPGQRCSACDQSIEPTETLAIEYRYGSAIGTHWFHEDCWNIWDEVRKEPVPRPLKPTGR